ncbi:MAG: hypothetical protein J6Q69_00665 [Clostridia bacterium]|nr:hypothetical protein [Clostridia bacterium]
MSKQKIAEVLKDDINDLYRNYIATDTPIEVAIPDAPVRTRAYYNEDEKV